MLRSRDTLKKRRGKQGPAPRRPALAPIRYLDASYTGLGVVGQHLLDCSQETSGSFGHDPLDGSQHTRSKSPSRAMRTLPPSLRPPARHWRSVVIAAAPVRVRQQLAKVATIDPGCARGALDEEVGFAVDRRDANDFAQSHANLTAGHPPRYITSPIPKEQRQTR